MEIKTNLEIIRTPEEMQAKALQWRADSVRIGLVPTMGALHDAHMGLVRQARELCDKLIVSIYVNPTQFGPGEDLDAYPRTFQSDCDQCETAGADLIFAPTDAAMYPPGFQTSVKVLDLSQVMCGANRPVHFGGVATICLKLFLICQPTVAVFGWKDAQQLLIIRRMVKDMNVPVEIVGGETGREADGLAMSSRNKYLTEAERAAAPVLRRALLKLEAALKAGETDAAKLLQVARAEIATEPAGKLQYLEMRSMDALETLDEVEPGNTLVALAAHFGKARLLDNVRL